MGKKQLSKKQTGRIEARREASRIRHTPHADQQFGDEQQGLVITHLRNVADVQSVNDSERIVRCHLRANLGAIVAGDRVLWQEGAEAGGVITSVYPRSSELYRPDSYGKMKLIAANVDRLVITFAPEPEVHANLLDRYLILAASVGLKAILVLNKADLLESHPAVQRILETYQQLGYLTFRVSAKDSHSLDSLKHELEDGISIFVGQSGVGKSSIIQTLLPEEQIKIGALSEQVKKGKHTTTHAKLYHFPFGGKCIDSPGIRELGLWHLTPDAISLGFPEFAEYTDLCRFRDCSHQHEPGCALLEALAQNKVSRQRFDSFQNIVGSLNDVQIHPSNSH